MAVALFGTDGVRGTANKYPMTPDLALKIGIAAGRVLKRGSHRHTPAQLRLAGLLACVTRTRNESENDSLVEFSMTA